MLIEGGYVYCISAVHKEMWQTALVTCKEPLEDLGLRKGGGCFWVNPLHLALGALPFRPFYEREGGGGKEPHSKICL